MNKLNCQNCNYCWKEEEDIFPCCHYEGSYPAPCEEEEEEIEDRYTLEDLGPNWW